MTTEEKARAYDEALDRMKHVVVVPENEKALRALKETIFPELAESEDEKIRKELLEEIEFITPRDGETDGEGLILPSYHARIDRYKSYLEKQKDQKPAVEQLDGTFNSYDMAKTFLEGQYYVIEHPEKFGLYKPAEWSEEEKKHLYNAIEAVKYVYDISEGTSGFKCVEFLKSLRPQPHWKPNEEDLMMLEHIIEQYEIGNKNSKIMGYFPRVKELDFLKKVLAKWKS